MLDALILKGRLTDSRYSMIGSHCTLLTARTKYQGAVPAALPRNQRTASEIRATATPNQNDAGL